MAQFVVKLDPTALANFIRSPEGPVFRRTFELAERVKQGAQAQVGVSRDAFFSPGLETSSQNPGGHLRDAIVKRVVNTATGFAILVGVFGELAERALFHHNGTRPHEIRATHLTKDGKPGFLRFFSVKAARIIYARKVNHPGTKPNRFLMDPLEALMRGLRGT